MLFYPLRDAEPQIAWAGNLDEASVSHLLHSAARQEIAKRILAGETAVWVFIKSGDASKDEPRLTLLRKELDRLQSEIELPDQETLEAEEEYRADNPIELKVAFSVIELSTEQAEEIPFIMTLLRSEPDLAGFEQPVAMPILREAVRITLWSVTASIRKPLNRIVVSCAARVRAKSSNKTRASTC
ncbi:MAG: hypothetical protein R3C28_16130 [Pirellulaceae bacterium]